MKANLHLHTTFSDGKCSVDEVVRRMAENGFEVISITDHDCLDGNIAAAKTASQYGMKYINGIETSASYRDILQNGNSNLSIHILGYGFDEKILASLFEERSQKKEAMAEELLRQLRIDGFDLSLDGSDIPLTRTAIAESLVRSGYATSIDIAFKTILDHQYSKYRVEKLSYIDIIRDIHNSHGIAIWAHPFEILDGNVKKTISPNQVGSVLSRLVLMGIDGIEARYAKYDDTQIQLLENMASELNLITTCGSDYHGKNEIEDRQLNSLLLFISETSRLNDLLKK